MGPENKPLETWVSFEKQLILKGSIITVLKRKPSRGYYRPVRSMWLLQKLHTFITSSMNLASLSNMSTPALVTSPWINNGIPTSAMA